MSFSARRWGDHSGRHKQRALRQAPVHTNTQESKTMIARCRVSPCHLTDNASEVGRGRSAAGPQPCPCAP
eukprot:1860862-Alexandrium_andersonii.AAC.1